MIRPERIAHVVLKVRNLARSRKFYTQVLGMDVMKESPEIGMLFLANNRRDHHEIALLEVGPQAEAPRANEIGLVHVAFRLRTEEDLRAAYKELKEREVPILLYRQSRDYQERVFSRSRWVRAGGVLR